MRAFLSKFFFLTPFFMAIRIEIELTAPHISHNLEKTVCDISGLSGYFNFHE